MAVGGAQLQSGVPRLKAVGPLLSLHPLTPRLLLQQLAAGGTQRRGREKPGRGLCDDAELRAVERRLLRQPAGWLGV